jgi:hypothetical protein
MEPSSRFQEITDDHDLKYNHNPVCPHCGYEHDDAWEWNFGDGMEGSIDIECSHCDSLFHVIREVEVTYSTSKINSVPTAQEKMESL